MLQVKNHDLCSGYLMPEMSHHVQILAIELLIHQAPWSSPDLVSMGSLCFAWTSFPIFFPVKKFGFDVTIRLQISEYVAELMG